MVKVKLLGVFVAAAIVSGSATLAPRAHAYWKMKHAVSCQPYSYGYGFRGPAEGELHVDAFGVSNTSNHQITMICSDDHDSNTYAGGSYLARVQFYKPYAGGQIPRVQFCGNYSCSYYLYGPSSTGFINMDFYVSQWRTGYLNTVQIPLDATDQDYGKEFDLRALTFGDELGPI